MLLFGMVPVAYAESNSIGTLPAYPDPKNERTNSIFLHAIKPGEIVKDGVRVVNDTKEERTVNLGVVDAIVSTNGSFSCRQNSEKRTGVATWVQLDKKQITLKPGANEVVDFIITSPKDVSPGEHGGCITAQDTRSYGDSKAKSGGVSLGMRYAIRIAVTTPGKIVKKLTVKQVEIHRTEEGNYTVNALAKNEGNVSLDVQARAQLVSMFGQKTPIKADGKYPIMPGATTGWAYEFKRPFWGGVYKARTSLAYNANPLDGLGENIGSVKTVRGETGYFFMIPAPKAIATYVGAFVLLVGFLVWRVRRKLGAKRLQKNWQTYTVRSGDTLPSLAAQYTVRWKKLARINHIKAPYMISAGNKLLLPLAPKEKGWSAPVTAARPVKTPPKKPVHVAAPYDPSVETPVEEDDWQPVASSRPARIIYAPRPTNVHRSKTTAKGGGYSWASPGSAWAPRVVSEDELEKIIQEKAARKTAASATKKPTPKKGQQTG